MSTAIRDQMVSVTNRNDVCCLGIHRVNSSGKTFQHVVLLLWQRFELLGSVAVGWNEVEHGHQTTGQSVLWMPQNTSQRVLDVDLVVDVVRCFARALIIERQSQITVDISVGSRRIVRRIGERFTLRWEQVGQMVLERVQLGERLNDIGLIELIVRQYDTEVEVGTSVLTLHNLDTARMTRQLGSTLLLRYQLIEVRGVNLCFTDHDTVLVQQLSDL